jgi:hypothetical protein
MTEWNNNVVYDVVCGERDPFFLISLLREWRSNAVARRASICPKEQKS